MGDANSTQFGTYEDQRHGVEKPKIRRPSTTSRNNSVRQSTVTRHQFAAAETNKRDKPTLSLQEVSNAVFPDCSSAVAFRYSHFDFQPQYNPCDDVNVGDCVDVTAVDQSRPDPVYQFC